jgi:hypothetical protein
MKQKTHVNPNVYELFNIEGRKFFEKSEVIQKSMEIVHEAEFPPKKMDSGSFIGSALIISFMVIASAIVNETAGVITIFGLGSLKAVQESQKIEIHKTQLQLARHILRKAGYTELNRTPIKIIPRLPAPKR